MGFGICNLSVIPVRKDADHRSEMVTQLLFGEHFEILSFKGDWASVKIAYDGYEGFVHKKSFLEISEHEGNELNFTFSEVTGDLVQLILNDTENVAMPLILGSSLPFLNNNKFTIGSNSYTFDGTVYSRKKFVERTDVIEAAFMYRNAPYLWGGRSPFGIDCSGLVQMVFKLNGIELQRDAAQQAEQGEPIMFAEEAEAGDLAFFDNEEGVITHVGIVLGGSKIIHASGMVRIDTLDHHGIFNDEQKKYTHKLRLLKKVI